jgi:hypothetical protein
VGGGGAGTAAVRTSRILRGGGAVEDVGSSLEKGVCVAAGFAQPFILSNQRLRIVYGDPKAQNRSACQATLFSPAARRVKNCAFYLTRKKIDTLTC